VADLEFAYAGLDAGNSFESGSLFTDTSGEATATLTTGNYSFEATAPTGYSILIPYALFGEFEILENETTEKEFPLVAVGTGADGTATDSPVVISQIYTAGGETDALFNRDFIELFNRGNSAVNLSGWSVQYADSMSSNWQVIALSGTLDPGRYYRKALCSR
jgi:hypothetical protein